MARQVTQITQSGSLENHLSIRQGRPRHDESSSLLEKTISVIIFEVRLRLPPFAKRSKISPLMTQPALSSVPSIPSVSQASAEIRRQQSGIRCRKVNGSASKTSALRPPRPEPRTVTVVSSTGEQHQRSLSGLAMPRNLSCDGCRCIFATSRLSPSMASPRIQQP